ncbi:MAG: ATP synthase F1 subunit delta [Desulfobacteraceae bacterium]
MKNLAIARRYAKALLLIGKEDGNTETYRTELNGVARRKVLSTVIEKLELSKVMASFLVFLFDKGRIGFLQSINVFYNKLADELKGVAHASLVSATELSSEAVEKIRSALSNKTGKEIVLDVSQDPELIGGIVTQIGDLVLDGSVKTQLLNMRESLKRGESV